MLKPALAACGLIAGLFAATTTLATDLNTSSEGWIYFHRAGATPAAHAAAVAACATLARQMGSPASQAGLVGALISSLAHDTAIAPNVENCMISNGWEVVRLDDTEGTTISHLDQKGQADALAPWVGAQTVHGTIVRRFEPLRDVGHGEVPLGGVLGNRRPSLSAMATPIAPAAPQREWKLHRINPITELAKAPAGSAFVVIRMAMSSPPNNMFNAARFDEATLNMHLFSVASPSKWRPKPGDYFEKTYVLAVPPGRWTYFGPWPMTLCLGAPGFDIAAGEALFLGTFTSGSKDPFAPDMALEPALADLTDADLKARLRAAKWVNGYRYDCNPVPYIYFPYRVDFPGFPSAPDNPPPS